MAPGGSSLTATAGVTLAGAAIDAAQVWKPKAEERVESKDGCVNFTVKAASAVALFIGPRSA